VQEGVGTVSKPKVLVVEDERIVALDIKGQLVDLGYQVPAIASWGEEAIRQAEETRPNLILMDIRLKGEMDGIEVAQHIRTHLDIPVIYLTAYADEDTLQRAKVTESYGYLLKPFEERDLRSAIEMALYKHEMECKLRESKQWLAATLNSIGDAVIATDSQGYIKFMNPIAQALTGWTEEQALGSDLGQVFHIISGETRAKYESPVERVLAEGSIVLLDENTLLVTREGKEIPIDDSAAPIIDRRGTVTGVVVVFRDVTERVRAHETLRQYAVELETRNEELDAFAHTVAHDIKSPLSTMIGYASLLQESPTMLADEERQEFLQIVADYGRQACSIVDELLLLAAVRSSEVKAETLDMSEIVIRVDRRLAHMRRKHRAEIVWPDEWPAALGYGPWIEEVWVNYLSNGIKYGGHPPHLELGGTAQPDGMVRFWIRDNGLGISPEDQDRLFTPFTRLHQVRTSGHGLGLSIVRRIVDKLGGEVGIESTPGQGSTFVFTLPGVGG
jgi:PAS domain S-box-containing protein